MEEDDDKEYMSAIELSVQRNSHYSQRTLRALVNFQRYWLRFAKRGRCQPGTERNRFYLLDATQKAWNELLRCRREETGVGGFLTPERYRDAVQSRGNNGEDEQC